MSASSILPRETVVLTTILERLSIVCSILFIVAPRSPLSASTFLRAPSTADIIRCALRTVKTSISEIFLRLADSGSSLNKLWSSFGVIVKTLGDSKTT